jgi:hypothetical protein
LLTEPRWSLAITHRKNSALEFIRDYFDDSSKRILLIAGAGFDPRATIIAEELSALAKATVGAALIRESRRGSDDELRKRAESNLATITSALPDHQLLDIEVFGNDGSVIGGRMAARLVSELSFNGLTDVVVDISALSIGTSFPIIRWLVEELAPTRPELNIHVVVAHQPELDARIRATPSDRPVPVHGFNGQLSLSSRRQDQARGPARLWLPQLARDRTATLRRIHEVVIPDEVCVVLPFPASDPRLGDSLLEELLESGGMPWDMDARSIVYADEGDPLDLYRTIMSLQALREPVFKETGGSTLILSPIGSKVMALGALLAALEGDLPVYYIEDFSYSIVPAGAQPSAAPDIMHVWLEGVPYTEPRAPLVRPVGP